MSASQILGLLAAGLVMGAVNNLGGGGGVLGLMALEFAGLPDPRLVNGSLRPAAVALATSGLLGFRSMGHRLPREMLGRGLATVPGAVAGVALAVTLPTWVYRSLLFLVVSAVFWRELRPGSAFARGTGPSSPTREILSFVLLGVYMGFVQVAFGLLCMLVLGRSFGRDLVSANAAKLAVVVFASITSVVGFATQGLIAWPQSSLLALGAGVGSFLAGRWSVARGRTAVRWAVLVICATLLVRLALQLLHG